MHRLQPAQEMTDPVSLLIDMGEQSAIPASVWTDLLTAETAWHGPRRGRGRSSFLLLSSHKHRPRDCRMSHLISVALITTLFPVLQMERPSGDMY
jgi:hypothetical protein